eukprot:3608041-Pleurochrysis_carterae.AAC.2
MAVKAVLRVANGASGVVVAVALSALGSVALLTAENTLVVVVAFRANVVIGTTLVTGVRVSVNMGASVAPKASGCGVSFCEYIHVGRALADDVGERAHGVDDGVGHGAVAARSALKRVQRKLQRADLPEQRGTVRALDAREGEAAGSDLRWAREKG